MYGSPSMPAAKDLNLTSPFAGGHLKEESTSNSSLFGGGGDHQEPQQMSSGLLRCRSAPSSLHADLCDDFLPVRTSCPEPDSTLFARFLASDLQIRGKPPAAAAAPTQQCPQFLPAHPPMTAVEGSGAFSSASQMNFHSQQKEPNHNSSVECSYPMVAASMAMEQMKSVHGGRGASSSNLVRHSSSPAGLFSHINVDNGYPILSENATMGNEASRLKNQISFSSRQNSIMSQISEAIGTGSSSEESGGSGGSGGGGRFYIPVFPANTWQNSSLFSGSNTFSENNGINPAEFQNGELLPHQFSLPKTSSEMAATKNYMTSNLIELA